MTSYDILWGYSALCYVIDEYIIWHWICQCTVWYNETSYNAILTVLCYVVLCYILHVALHDCIWYLSTWYGVQIYHVVLSTYIVFECLKLIQVIMLKILLWYARKILWRCGALYILSFNLCCIMHSCNIVLKHVTLSHIALHYVTSCCSVLCHFTSWGTMRCFMMPHSDKSCCALLCYVLFLRNASCLRILWHAVLWSVVSCSNALTYVVLQLCNFLSQLY